jgi:hypothetical protein
MTLLIFEMANIKFKAMREKERRKKSIEAQPQLVYAHAPNHWEKKKKQHDASNTVAKGSV